MSNDTQSLDNVTTAKANQNEEGSPVLPIPEGVDPKTIPGNPVMTTLYRDASGGVLFYVLRFMQSDGKKKDIPYCWWKYSDGREGWNAKQPLVDNRPLLNLPDITNNIDKPIYVGEGEKVARALQKLFPNAIATTSCGGAKASSKSDWSVVKDRDVIICPDNDISGIEYAQEVYRLCQQAGARSIRIINMHAFAEYAVENSQIVNKIRPISNEWAEEKEVKVIINNHELLWEEGSEEILASAAQANPLYKYIKPKLLPGWDIADVLDEGWTAESLQQLEEALRQKNESLYLEANILFGTKIRDYEQLNAQLDAQALMEEKIISDPERLLPSNRIDLPCLKNREIEDLIYSAATFIQVPLEMSLISVLGDLSILAQSIVDIEMPTNEYDTIKIPSLEFYMVSGESGDRKSALDNYINKKFYAFTQKLTSNYRKEKETYKKAYSDWKHNKPKSSDVPDWLNREPQEPKEPEIQRQSDITIEAIADRFEGGCKNLSICTSEGYQFTQGHSANETPHKMITRLSLYWDATGVPPTTKGKRYDHDAEDCRLSVNILIQPKGIKEFFNNALYENQGILSR